jgi:hypothetical protein
MGMQQRSREINGRSSFLNYHNIPLDVSKFDNSISLVFQRAVVLALSPYFPQYAHVIDAIADRFYTNSFLEYTAGADKKFRINIEFGLMSGIKMTSLFGSIINYAILRYVCKKSSLTPSYVAILGDDVDLSFSMR